MPKTTVERATRVEIDPVLEAIASFSETTLSDRREAWTNLLAALVDDAHEAAHRENERRWAVEQTEVLGVGTYGEDAEAVQDLLIRVRRNWRLSRETSRTSTYDVFSKYATLSGNAATELEAEYGIEVAWTIDGGWTVSIAD